MSCMCVKQLCTSLGLVVDEDPDLVALGAKHCKRLRTTKPRKEGDLVASYYGAYRARLPQKQTLLDCITITCPGAAKDTKFLKASPMCPAVFANDPTFREETNHFEVNCALQENDTEDYGSEWRVSLTCTVDIPIASEDEPVTLWTLYNTKEIKVHHHPHHQHYHTTTTITTITTITSAARDRSLSWPPPTPRPTPSPRRAH